MNVRYAALLDWRASFSTNSVQLLAVDSIDSPFLELVNLVQRNGEPGLYSLFLEDIVNDILLDSLTVEVLIQLLSSIMPLICRQVADHFKGGKLSSWSSQRIEYISQAPKHDAN